MPATSHAGPARRHRTRLLAAVLGVLSLYAPVAVAQLIVVKPGELDRFAVSAPALAAAGSSFEVVVEALDAQGNRITERAGIPGRYAVDVGAGASVEPQQLDAAAFEDGLARLQVTPSLARPLVLLISGPDNRLLGQGREVYVRPGPLARFRIQAPSVIEAGIPAVVGVEALDAFGNLVTDLSPLGRELTLGVEGGGLTEPGAVSLGLFQGGRASFPVVYKVAKPIQLVVAAPRFGVRGSSETIRVRPGPPAYFQLEPPARVTAGTPFPVTLRVLDEYNNPVSDYSRIGADVVLGKSGPGTIEPRSVEARSFRDGEARVQLTVTRAESFRITATARELNNSSEVIEALPADVAAVDIELPPTARVHQPFELRLTLRDAFGNLVSKPANASRELQIGAERGSVEGGRVALSSFVNGLAQPAIALSEVGSYALEVKLGDSLLGSSNPIEVRAGETERFTVDAPSVIVAGEPFEVTITALDAHDNLVRDYDRRGERLTLASVGDGPLLLPYPVMPSEFQDGRARVSPVLEKSGALRIAANGPQGRPLGTSETLTVRTSRPDHFLISAPESAVSGSPFTVRIEARDRFSNLVTDYDRVGLDVRLESDGQGKLEPAIVPATAFQSGVASVSLTYDRAEAFSLRAHFATALGTGAEGNGHPPPLLGRGPAQSTLGRTSPSRRLPPRSGPTTTPGPRLTPTPVPVATPRATPAATPRPTATPRARVATPTPVPTPARTPPPRPAESPTPASEAGFRITAVSYDEQQGRGVLELDTTGLVGVEVSTQLRYGDEWLLIELTPVLNDPAPLLAGLEMSLFGQIDARLVGRSASIALQLNVNKLDYNVSRRTDGVTVSFRRLGP